MKQFKIVVNDYRFPLDRLKKTLKTNYPMSQLFLWPFTLLSKMMYFALELLFIFNRAQMASVTKLKFLPSFQLLP